MSIIALFYLLLIVFQAFVLGCWGKRRYGINKSIYFCLFGFITGIISAAIVFHTVKMPEKEVKISLEELDKSATEVFLKEVLIDGKEYEIGDFEEGKWAWRGKKCGWMNMEGTILKDITTSIVLKIPDGYSRTLKFASDAKGGTICIEEDGANQKIDIEEENSITLESCRGGMRRNFRFLQLVVFEIFYLLMCFILYVIVKNKDRFQSKVFNYKFYIAYLGIAIVSLVCMISLSEKESLWYDEMFTLGYAGVHERPNSGFIVFELMCLWVKFIPYGQKFVLLLPIIATAISIYLAGVTGKRLINGRTGLYVATLLGFSSYVYAQVALEFRTYFMLLLMSVLTYYLFCVRDFKYEIQSKWLILAYGISLLLLTDSHEYGKLVAGIFIVLDIILILFKKIKKVSIISDLFPIIYLIYWLKNNDVGRLWNNYSVGTQPDIETVYRTLEILCSNNKIIFSMLVLGCLVIIYNLIKDKSEVKDMIELHGKEVTLLILIIGVFAASITYSIFVNPQNSLYIDRYFISVIAFILIVVAVGINFCVEKFCKRKTGFFSMFIVLMISISGYTGYIKDSSFWHNQKYREAAQWLSCQKDIYNEKTAIFIPDNGYVVSAFSYYMSDGKEKDSAVLKSKYNFDITTPEYDKLYVVEPAFGPTEEQNQFLLSHYVLEDHALEKNGNEYVINIYTKK